MIFQETGNILENIILVDVNGWRNNKTTSSYILIGDNIGIFDPGGYSSGQNLINFLDENRIKIDNVKYIFVSHRHNDHSGGASYLVKKIPGAKIYAHRITIENLINPEKINKATRDMYGDFSEEIEKVDREKLVTINDGETFRLGKNAEIVAIHMPGHTSDHFMFLEKHSGFIFTGDGAGLFSPSSEQLIPNSFPPSFKYNEYRKSFLKLMEISPRIIGFSHFGAVSDKDSSIILEKGLKTLDEWKEMVEMNMCNKIKEKYINDFSLFSDDIREKIFDIVLQGFKNGLKPV
jgi:glyoxylase-like metal-dependent hydrolase (beta-lactamase superfamily II)